MRSHNERAQRAIQILDKWRITPISIQKEHKQEILDALEDFLNHDYADVDEWDFAEHINGLVIWPETMWKIVLTLARRAVFTHEENWHTNG